jgi:FHS family L-fucose permease-like MFS transporter
MAGVYVGSFVMFKDTDATREQLTQMSASDAAIQQLEMIQSTLLPYKWMIAVLILMFVLIAFTKFPACKGIVKASVKSSSLGQSLSRLWRNPRFTFGVLAQFLYVGAQVGVWSFTIRLAMQMGGMNERSASWFLLTTFAAYFVGKMIANLLMRKMHPAKVLAIYGVLTIALLAYTILVPNISAVYAAVGVSIFLGPCWPTIYGLTIDGLGEDTGVGGSLLVMSIVGGGVMPIFQGLLSDATHGNMQIAYTVPLLCFVVIVAYAIKCMRDPRSETAPVGAVTAS